MAAKNKNDKKNNADDDNKDDDKDDNFWKNANPFESSMIPESLQEEIYRAEAKTPAAKERRGRLVGYGIATLVALAAITLNLLLTSTEETTPLEETMFAVVPQNALLQLWLHTKIGGFLNFAIAAACITLMEQEFLVRRQTAEEIWKETDRRRLAGSSSSSSTTTTTEPKKTKKKKKKKKKKASGLTEVVAMNAPPPDTTTTTTTTEVEKSEFVQDPETDDKSKTSLLRPLQDFYEKADQMAASQALLLNKQLEDAGVLEKITDDETGLKVVKRGEELLSSSQEEEEEEEEK